MATMYLQIADGNLVIIDSCALRTELLEMVKMTLLKTSWTASSTLHLKEMLSGLYANWSSEESRFFSECNSPA